MEEGGEARNEAVAKGVRKCPRCRRLVVGGEHECGLELKVLRDQEAIRATKDALPAMSTEEAGRALNDLLDDRRARQTEEMDE